MMLTEDLKTSVEQTPLPENPISSENKWPSKDFRFLVGLKTDGRRFFFFW